jgi:8-amino-7-oxononanoate synthase
MIEIESWLQELKATGLHRRTRLISGPQGPHVLLDGKPVLVLCSNNYLGLADHPRVRAAAADAAMRWGVGAGASRLESGTMIIHHRLEERLAEFENRESALLFGSGFLANAGAIAALARPGDVVFADALCHPSILDGCRLSRAETFVYDHLDVEHLEWGLEQAEGRGALIATDSVFSIDGDVAPLAEIVELAERHRVRVLVDEAHAIGTLGPAGRGALAELGLEGEVDVIVGTLSTGLGSYGGFVACDRAMARYLLHAARSLIHSTAPSPPAIAGALAALELIEARPQLVHRLAAGASMLRDELEREGFDVNGSRTQIIPLPVGDPQTAVRMCEHALSRGVFVQTIRPPVVASVASCLRLAVMASHRPEDLHAAARALGHAARAVGFDPRLLPARGDGESTWERADSTLSHDPPERRAPRRRTIWGPPAEPAQSAVFDYEAPDPMWVERAA